MFNLHYIIDICIDPIREKDFESLSQNTEYHQNQQIPSG